MPIYEFECRKCKEVFSVFQTISSSENETKCPKCSSQDVRKIVSAFSCFTMNGGLTSPGSYGRG